MGLFTLTWTATPLPITGLYTVIIREVKSGRAVEHGPLFASDQQTLEQKMQALVECLEQRWLHWSPHEREQIMTDAERRLRRQ